MELWIRSQDRERLSIAHDLRIYYAKTLNLWVVESCDDLGYYSTKERALEVLDEIQEMDFVNNPNVKITNYGYVYEMPKE